MALELVGPVPDGVRFGRRKTTWSMRLLIHEEKEEWRTAMLTMPMLPCLPLMHSESSVSS